MKVNIKLMFYIAIFLLYVSYLIPYSVVDPRLALYEKEYLTYVNKYCHKDQFLKPIQKSLDIINLSDDNIIATCSSNNITKIHISYNKKHWEEDSEDTKTIIMWHEFTHCYFNEGHSEDPNHFMYAYNNNISLDTAKKQLEEYLQKKCK